MELLLGSVVSILVEIFKYISKKKGKEFGKAVIIGVVFLLAFVVAWMRSQGYLDIMIYEWLKIGTVAVGFYEVIYKSILSKVFSK